MNVRNFQKVKLTTQFDVATERKNIESGQNLSELLGRQALINQCNAQIYEIWNGTTAAGASSLQFTVSKTLKPRPDAMIFEVAFNGSLVQSVFVTCYNMANPMVYNVLATKNGNDMFYQSIGISIAYESSRTSNDITYIIQFDQDCPSIKATSSAITTGGAASAFQIIKIYGVKFGV